MRLFVAAFLVSATACSSSGDGGAIDGPPADATVETFDAAPEVGWVDSADAEVDDVDIPDYGTRPDAAGWCLSRGGKWGCELGGACTFDGHCVSPDAGLADAGVKSCGAIGCDPAWCICIDRAASTCDCTP